MVSKGVVREVFRPVIVSEWIFLESGKLIKRFRRDSTATEFKKMAWGLY